MSLSQKQTSGPFLEPRVGLCQERPVCSCATQGPSSDQPRSPGIAEQQGSVDQAPAPSPYLLEDSSPVLRQLLRSKTKVDACSTCCSYKRTCTQVWPQRAKPYILDEIAEVPPFSSGLDLGTSRNFVPAVIKILNKCPIPWVTWILQGDFKFPDNSLALLNCGL